ncbi:MAG: LysM peptidoglycan-binding domain-containing protein [Pseudomonadales bacterium]
MTELFKSSSRLWLVMALVYMAGCASQSQVAVSTQTSTTPTISPVEQTLAPTAEPQVELTVAEPEIVDFFCSPDDNIAWLDTPYVDVWDRVRDGLVLDYSQQNKRIDQQFNWYKKHPEYVSRVSNRASLYLHHIVDELDENQVPMELALLPIVESAYDPFAYSQGFAAGMWQFIPGTGKMYGLKQNWWYDGRRDVKASTSAAIKYLSEMARHYDGDWALALASYNTGMGRVDRAIRKNRAAGKPTDFFSLDLPRETRAYVPKLLALAKLLADADEYQVTFNAIPNEPYFTAIDTGKQIDLKEVAKITGIDMAHLRSLNPGFNRSLSDPRGPHTLLLPSATPDQIIAQLDNMVVNGGVNQSYYTVKSGDTLWQIARNNDISVKELAGWNALNPSRSLKIGQRLAIGSQAVEDLPSNGETMRKVNYSVRRGDSLSRIASKFKVSIGDIKRWNTIKVSDYLQPGQILALHVDVTRTSL